MQVHLGALAIRQLNDILAYIAAENPTAAQRFVMRMEEVRQLLAENPLIGYKLPRGRLRRFPERPYPYLIYNKVTPNTVRIMRIRHSAQYRKALHEPVLPFAHS
jgi:plasmid stabilization system protein ParE